MDVGTDEEVLGTQESVNVAQKACYESNHDLGERLLAACQNCRSTESRMFASTGTYHPLGYNDSKKRQFASVEWHNLS